jgi:hypothetical protein
VAEGFHTRLHCVSGYREVDHGRLHLYPYLHILIIHDHFPPNVAVNMFAFGRSLVHISGRRPAVLTETCHGFPQSLQASTGIVHEMARCPFPPIGFPCLLILRPNYHSTLYNLGISERR